VGKEANPASHIKERGKDTKKANPDVKSGDAKPRTLMSWLVAVVSQNNLYRAAGLPKNRS